MNKKFFLRAAAVILLAALLFIIFHPRQYILQIEDSVSGEELMSFKADPGDRFSVTFIHSVNKSPVSDFYEIREDGIYVVKTVYYSFGAGVETELMENESLSYGDDGSMIITGFNKKMDDLQYFVGTVSDHILKLYRKDSSEEYRTVSLRDELGRNRRVRFTLRKV